MSVNDVTKVCCSLVERKNIEWKNIERKNIERKNIEMEKCRKFQLTRHALFLI